MIIRQLLRNLANNNVQISVVGDNLKINAPNGVITTEITQTLSHYKPEIIEFLNNAKPQKMVISKLSNKKNIPLSFAQQGLWFIKQLDKNTSINYNIVTAFNMYGELNTTLLIRCFQDIWQRHESLRTLFKTNKGKATQVVNNKLQLPIDVILFFPKAILTPTWINNINMFLILKTAHYSRFSYLNWI